MVRHDSDFLGLGPKYLRGSRLRCLMLTSLSRESVAQTLTALVKPFALVGPKDFWMPGGFLKLQEAKLGGTPGFLCARHREIVTGWRQPVVAVAQIANLFLPLFQLNRNLQLFQTLDNALLLHFCGNPSLAVDLGDLQIGARVDKQISEDEATRRIINVFQTESHPFEVFGRRGN